MSGGDDGCLLWSLDWELGDDVLEEWDERAGAWLDVFLALHTPTAESATGRLARLWRAVSTPMEGTGRTTKEQMEKVLSRQGKPVWSEEDFRSLLQTLGWAGLGWLKPEVVRLQLERRARHWKGTAIA